MYIGKGSQRTKDSFTPSEFLIYLKNPSQWDSTCCSRQQFRCIFLRCTTVDWLLKVSKVVFRAVNEQIETKRAHLNPYQKGVYCRVKQPVTIAKLVQIQNDQDGTSNTYLDYQRFWKPLVRVSKRRWWKSNSNRSKWKSNKIKWPFSAYPQIKENNFETLLNV